MSIDSPDINALPAPLQGPVGIAWANWQQAAAEQGLDRHILDRRETAGLLAEVPLVWGASPFVATSLAQHPALLPELIQQGLRNTYPRGEMRRVVSGALQTASNEADLGRQLRQLRRREMVRIAWRDISGRATLQQTLADLSNLADCCIDLALQALHGWLCARLGTPCNDAGEPQQLVVLAMGKLGGQELNFSSDIDLIFTYPENGETIGGPKPLDNGQFFLRLGRQLVKVLDERTADGFVYRTDMRLRPHGSAGPLAISFAAMESYYQSQGRAWERYAMVKARVVAGDRARGAELLQQLRPFVYRRYLDFGAIESLRDLKRSIRAEVLRKGMQDNIKLGSGGIREVEFTVQALQILHGGRDRSLQQQPLLPVLTLLKEKRLLPMSTADALADAYTFLRQLENRIQQIDDRQRQELPASAIDRERLVLGMQMPDWDTLISTLNGHRQAVADAFEQVFSESRQDQSHKTGGAPLASVWASLEQAPQAEGEALLSDAGFASPADMLSKLRALQQRRQFRSMSDNGRQRLDQLIPLLIKAAARTPRPDTTLSRLITIIEAIGQRASYFGLLTENPSALQQLVRLSAASDWISQRIARHPLLLDELLDPRSLFAPPRKAGLEAELQRLFEQIDPTDVDALMDGLRRFQMSNQLRVAAADVVGALPLMVVSDHLTEIAEVTLDGVLRGAWAQLSTRHGRPSCQLDGASPDSGFAIIGYGKLGGIELGYGSDLDIIFLHAATPGSTTDGDKPIDSNKFFARLAQRIIHIISTRTAAGRLYETDLRLRPSGASGLLVTSIDAMQAYQQQQAWTWEHQALVRARPISGDPAVGRAFDALRRKVLSQRRDPQVLRREVREMREKMRQALGSPQSDQFHLKQDPGGIADIEFLVQFGVLRWSTEHTALLDWTDNIRLLNSFVDCGLLPRATAETLAEAYRAYRKTVHQLALQGQAPVIAADAFVEQRRAVGEQWRQWLHD